MCITVEWSGKDSVGTRSGQLKPCNLQRFATWPDPGYKWLIATVDGAAQELRLWLIAADLISGG
jgi:hypothetical protein